MFIDIFGIDGCGKSTHSLLLKKFIENNYNLKVEIIHAFKPSKFVDELKNLEKTKKIDFHNTFSNQLRSNLYVIDFLYNMQKIKNKINDGIVIITEKYNVDLEIYLPLLGSELFLYNSLKKNILKPDIAFHLSINPQIAYNRILERSFLEKKIIAPKESFEIMTLASQSFSDYCSNHKSVIVIDSDYEKNIVSEKICKSFVNFIEKNT